MAKLRRPKNRLVQPRLRGLAGPFFQQIAPAQLIHTPGNYLAAVGGATLVSIAVTPDAGTIDYEATRQFTATGTYSDSSTADITGDVTWDSSDDAVATITAGGLATGTGVGTATISATLGAVSGDTTLAVIWYSALLFGNSEAGADFEPFRQSSLFQGSNGTTAVTAAADPVGYIADQSGNDYHAVQTVSGDRPAYTIDADGKPYLRLDQTDCLRFNIAAFGSTAPLSMYAVAAANTLADYCMVLSTDSISEAVQIAIGDPQTGTIRNAIGGGTAGIVKAAGTTVMALNAKAFLGFAYTNVALYANVGGVWEKVTLDSGTFADIATSAAIGDGSAGSLLNSYTNFYAGLSIRRILTAEEQNLLGAEWAHETGCTYNPVKYAIALGDSTIADYGGNTSILGLLTSAHTETTLAVPGDTITGQTNKFKYAPQSMKAAWVVIQVGLNDLDPGEAASAAIARLQSLVNVAIATTGDYRRVFISKLNPCRARLITLYGAINGPIAYQKWLDINEAIMNGGATPLTGVGGRISAHEPLLNDGVGNLAAVYDTGDGIHPNNAGRQIVADAWSASVTAAGFVL